MPNFIANVTVPAPVIQLNNDQYLVDGQFQPRTLNVPCGINSLVDANEWWATPVKDFGVTTILQMIPKLDDNVAQPTPDSITVIKVSDKYTPFWTWWIVCSLEDYYNACATCCGDEPENIPEPALPIIVPCQYICNSTNAEGEYISIFGFPPDDGEFWGYGQYNGVDLPTIHSPTKAGLVVLMNAQWGSIGTPTATFVWTESNDILTATGGFAEDSICVLIVSVEPSP